MHRDPKVILTTDDIQKWESDISRIDTSIASLMKERDQVVKLMEAAQCLLSGITEPTTEAKPANASADHSDVRSEHSETAEVLSSIASECEITDATSWVDAARSVVHWHERGVASHVLRGIVAASPLGDRLRVSDKGYYNAVNRLQKRGEIEKHNGRFFYPNSLLAYKEAVSRGEMDDAPPKPPQSYSPMGEAVEAMVNAQPGIPISEVVSNLQADPKFSDSLSERTTVAYNVVARLRKRKKIEKRGKGLFPASQKNDEPQPLRANGSVGNGHGGNYGAFGFGSNPG